MPTPTKRLSATQLSAFLGECRYRTSLVETNIQLPDDRHAAWAAFAHIPKDSRSACIAAIDGLIDPEQDAFACRSSGAPVIFVCLGERFEWWKQGAHHPVWLETISANDAAGFFHTHRKNFAPEIIYRAKTWGRVDPAHQLEFVDLGLMPLVEAQAGRDVE